MKRAIEKAMEEFPIVGDLHLRNAYISGYHQAEKDFADTFQAEYAKELDRADLSLTWEDVAILITIYEQEVEAGNISRYEDEGAPSLKEASEIILRRFNEIRKK